MIVPLAAALTVLGTVGLERLTAWGQARFEAWRDRGGLARALLKSGVVCGAAFAGVIGCTVAADQAVRTLDPQETLGWGERPSLVPDPDVGWRLAASQATRLRWISHDYTVEANALGFPGPEPRDPRPPDEVRILTLGGAFTSAEGVDTDEAWPRRLERALTARTAARPAELLNFAITGHGPNQYAAVALAVVWHARRRGLSRRRLADAAAYGGVFGWILGRAGCAWAHDHPGRRTDFALAVLYPDDPRHDLGLYELALTVLLAAVLWALQRRPREPGARSRAADRTSTRGGGVHPQLGHHRDGAATPCHG